MTTFGFQLPNFNYGTPDAQTAALLDVLTSLAVKVAPANTTLAAPLQTK